MRPVPEPPSSSTPLTEANSFETISPALAAALIAADQLAYSHCKLHRNAKDAVFVFRDPLQIGEELQRRYNAGVFPLVHAKMLAETRGFLSEESTRVKGGRNVSKS
jgi:hypothetical protein